MITCKNHSGTGRRARFRVRRGMQWAIFSVIAAAVLAVAARAPAWAKSSAAGPQRSSPTVLARMVEKDDRIIYGTDPEGQKSSRELEREEREKQERSWQMLERTEIYNFPPNRPRPPRPDPPPR